MIFDIIVVYGKTNAGPVRRLIEMLLKIQPKYRNDLIEAIKYFQTTFTTIQDEINQNDSSLFDDIAIYVLDCAYTIQMLVCTVPNAYDICLEVKLEQLVTRFYDHAIPMLHKNMSLIDPNSAALQHLNFARLELIDFFYGLTNKCIQDVLQDS